jgi:formylglycine-generating enzyme required for sulfatase activity
MKRTIYTLLVMLLVCSIVAMGQIKPIKRQNSTTPKTEKTQKKSTTKKGKKSTGSSTRHNLPAVVRQMIADMVYVQGGTFMMGGTSEQGKDVYESETPAHQVTLSSFYICKYEVTQELWDAVMSVENPSYFWGTSRLPVDQVSWDECDEFIEALNKLTGKRFRRPTEAEWEFAARGGNKSKRYKYSGSNNLDDVAWYKSNSGEATHPVGTKAPNELGLYDMSGNVLEWCDDWYGPYGHGSEKDPTGPLDGDYCVIRGGGWNSGAVSCRVSNRVLYTTEWSNEYGFRLAL